MILQRSSSSSLPFVRQMREVSRGGNPNSDPLAGYYTQDLHQGSHDALTGGAPTSSRSRRRRWLLLGGLALVVVLAVAIPVGVVKSRNSSSSKSISSSSSGSSSTRSGSSTSPAAPAASGAVGTFGLNGSCLRLDNGSEVTYVNPFGGQWRYDATNPTGPGGRAQEWSRQISPDEKVDWASDHMYGVNLGGWLVLEVRVLPSFQLPPLMSSSSLRPTTSPSSHQRSSRSGARSTRPSWTNGR